MIFWDSMIEFYHQQAVFVQTSVARFAGFDNLSGVIPGLTPGVTDMARLRRS